MKRPLPTLDEATEILARTRTKPQHRPPPAAGRRLTKFVKELDQRFGQGPAVLQARWREIVGETLARRTEPVKVTKPRGGPGALELRVEGPAATLIQHQAGEIIARVNLFLGAGAVDKLRIVQGPVRKLETPVIGAPKRRKPPLDAAAEAALEEGLAPEPEGPLKQALRTLGREVLRRNTPR
ncbi:MAG: hypothetical protein JWO33_1661 [Caulobacteraceae bacterium]|nr:hypothetical protein [Caulobacteraceae bacterium]